MTALIAVDRLGFFNISVLRFFIVGIRVVISGCFRIIVIGIRNSAGFVSGFRR